MPFGIAWTDEPGRRSATSSRTSGGWARRGRWSAEDWMLTFGVWEARPAGRVPGPARARVPCPPDGRDRLVDRARVPGPRDRQADAPGGARARVRPPRRGGRRDRGVHRQPGVEQGQPRRSATSPTGSASSRRAACRAPTQRFRLTLEGWRARPRPEVIVEGLEGCLGMFGLSAGRPSARLAAGAPARRSEATRPACSTSPSAVEPVQAAIHHRRIAGQQPELGLEPGRGRRRAHGLEQLRGRARGSRDRCATRPRSR